MDSQENQIIENGEEKQSEKGNFSQNFGIVVFLILFCSAVFFMYKWGSESSSCHNDAEQSLQVEQYTEQPANATPVVVEPELIEPTANAVAVIPEEKTESTTPSSSASTASKSADPLWDDAFVKYMAKNYSDVDLSTNGLKSEITIKAGVYLTKVALENYGDKSYWIYLYLYNKDRIKNPDNVRIGTKIRIPKLDKSLADGSSEKTVAVANQVRKDFVN